MSQVGQWFQIFQSTDGVVVEVENSQISARMQVILQDEFISYFFIRELHVRSGCLCTVDALRSLRFPSLGDKDALVVSDNQTAALRAFAWCGWDNELAAR